MLEFIMFMGGAIFGLVIASLINTSSNAEERERAEHAVKMAEYYKQKCKELQDKQKGK